jgi:hypothetical protein
MNRVAIIASSLLVAVSLTSFETPARAGNDDSAYVRGQPGADQRGWNDEWRRQQPAGNRHRHEYNQNWRLGQRYYEPDYGLNIVGGPRTTRSRILADDPLTAA